MAMLVLPTLAAAAPPIQATGSAAKPTAQRPAPQAPRTVRVDPPITLSASERTQLDAVWNRAVPAFKADKDVAKLKAAGSTLPPPAREVWGAWMSQISKSGPRARRSTGAAAQLGPWNYVIESATVTGYNLTMDNCRLELAMSITLRNTKSPYPATEPDRTITVRANSDFSNVINEYPLPRLMTGQRHTMGVAMRPTKLVWPAYEGCAGASAQDVGYINLLPGTSANLWRIRWGGFSDPTVSIALVEVVDYNELILDILFGD